QAHLDPSTPVQIRARSGQAGPARPGVTIGAAVSSLPVPRAPLLPPPRATAPPPPCHPRARRPAKEPEMSTNSQAVPLTPVPPSLVVRVAMRPMTKVLNPLMGKLAGRRHIRMAAEIRHVGRTSRRAYVTSVGAHVSGDVAVIPLTFGNQSDWSKNVRAAGGCSIR